MTSSATATTPLLDGLVAHGYHGRSKVRIATHLPKGSPRSHTSITVSDTDEVIGTAVMRHLNECLDANSEHRIEYDLMPDEFGHHFSIKTESGVITFMGLYYGYIDGKATATLIKRTIAVDSSPKSIGICLKEFLGEHAAAIGFQ